MAVDKRIFPPYEIPGSRAIGTTEKNAAYSTLPASAVKFIKRTNKQTLAKPNCIATGITPLFLYTVGDQEYLDITSVQTTFHGEQTYISTIAPFPTVVTTHGLDFTGVCGKYAGTTIYVQYLINEKTSYQITSWTGTAQNDPTQRAAGGYDLPDPFESNASDNYFHLIVKPNETFKIVLRATSTYTVIQLGLSLYSGDLYFLTKVCGRLIPKQTFEEIQKESGYSL